MAEPGEESADNEAIVRRFVEDVVVGGDRDALAELVDPDVRMHFLGAGTDVEGRDAYADYLRQSEETFSATEVLVDSVVADGSTVVLRGRVSGVNTGAYHHPDGMTFPATGERFETDTYQEYRLDDGVIVEGWRLTDSLSLARQLGWLPDSPGKLVRFVGQQLNDRLSG